MRQKLLLLDLVLLLMIAGLGWRLRLEWVESKAHHEAMLRQRVKPIPAPPMSVLAPPAPLKAAEYVDIAQKMLFSKDRNPTVAVEVAPPPPPKPMPELPLFFGVMNLGDGPTAILSEKKGTPNKDYRPGEKIGEFTLVALNNDEIVLEWDGKRVTRRLSELVDRTPPAAAPANQQDNRSNAPQAPQPKVDGVPGVDIGRGVRACQQGDTSAPGTVVDGLRKVVTESPFGPVCRWEPLNSNTAK